MPKGYIWYLMAIVLNVATWATAIRILFDDTVITLWQIIWTLAVAVVLILSMMYYIKQQGGVKTKVDRRLTWGCFAVTIVFAILLWSKPCITI